MNDQKPQDRPLDINAEVPDHLAASSSAVERLGTRGHRRPVHTLPEDAEVPESVGTRALRQPVRNVDVSSAEPRTIESDTQAMLDKIGIIQRSGGRSTAD